MQTSKFIKNILSMTIFVFLFTSCGEKQGAKLEGVSSGGGNYSQKSTHQVLELAKAELARSLIKMPDWAFSKFPSDLNKNEMIRIIQEIKFLPDVRRKRDGMYLKLDYDPNLKTIVATYDFYIIYNAPSILRLASGEQNQISEMIRSIQIDILHELSHLFEIGKSADTDFTSEVFATLFLEYIRAFRISCESETLKAVIDVFENSYFVGTNFSSQSSDGLDSLHLTGSDSLEDLVREYKKEYNNTADNDSEIKDFLEDFEERYHLRLVTSPELNKNFIDNYLPNIEELYLTSLNGTNLPENKMIAQIFNSYDPVNKIFKLAMQEYQEPIFLPTDNNSEDNNYTEYSGLEMYSEVDLEDDLTKMTWTWGLRKDPTAIDYIEKLASASDFSLDKQADEFENKIEFNCKTSTNLPFDIKPFQEIQVDGPTHPRFFDLLENSSNYYYD